MKKRMKLRHSQPQPIYMEDFCPWNSKMYLNYLRGLKYRISGLHRHAQKFKNRKLLHEISRLKAEVNYLSRIVVSKQGRRN